MPTVLGILAIAFLVIIAIAGVTGRLTMRSCCSPVPPELDLRINPGVDPSTAAGADR
ncbi:unannotated protein [freshwater metagenome]|uniref:Unannotated protein n=1 Tax=freshwater metagenome TaxID=449393 RepID=A0A6J7IDP1_9ZZZZ